MNDIIAHLKRANNGYTLGNNVLQITGYGDDVVLMADIADDLQKLLRRIKLTEQLYMKISS